MRKQALKTEWGNVAYWVSDIWEKNRDTIFFLHGLTADHTMFEFQYQFFEGKYNIIAWDAPAHGESRPFGEGYYSKSDKWWLKQVGRLTTQMLTDPIR